jgi:molybdate transport system substrate-binding protein
MKYLPWVVLAVATLIAPAAAAGTISIAAAADLKFCMDDLVAAFKNAHAAATVNVSYGSSGNFSTQIRQGAPFDLFFSADIQYPRDLARDGFSEGESQRYAVGRIVLWSASMDATMMTLADLAHPDVRKIAIANPQHAPYGKRAQEALQASHLWDKVDDKIVYGENIAQTAQFVQSGNAQVGIIALSLALNPDLAAKGGYYLIPDSLHRPLEQGFILTKRAAGNPLATAFADYVRSAPARAIMVHYGFALSDQEIRR